MRDPGSTLRSFFYKGSSKLFYATKLGLNSTLYNSTCTVRFLRDSPRIKISSKLETKEIAVNRKKNRKREKYRV